MPANAAFRSQFTCYVDKSAVTQRPRRGGYRAAEPAVEGFTKNQVWCEIVALACELLAWTQMLALAGEARRWEPKRLRLRIFAVAGRLARGGRRLRLRLAERWPWADSTPPRSSACKPSRPADQPEHPDEQEGENTRARGTPPTRRDSRAAGHGRPENQPQPNTSGQQITDAKDRGKLLS